MLPYQFVSSQKVASAMVQLNRLCVSISCSTDMISLCDSLADLFQFKWDVPQERFKRIFE